MADGEAEPKYLLPRSITLGDQELPIDTFVFAALTFDSIHRQGHDFPSGKRVPPYPNPEDDEDIKHFHQAVTDMAQSAGAIVALTPPDMKELLLGLDGLAEASIARWANDRAKAIRSAKRYQNKLR